MILFLRIFCIAVIGFAALATAQAQSVNAPSVSIDDYWSVLQIDDWTKKEKGLCKYTVIGKVPAYNRMRSECRTQINPINQRIDVTSLASTSEFTLVEDWNFVFRVGSQNYKRINFDWPLHIDKKWSYTYKQNAGVGTAAYISSYVMNAHVVGWENIDIGKVTYRTIKVEHVGTWSNTNTGADARVAYTYWYSPDLKRWVKFSFESDDVTGAPSARDTYLVIETNVAR